MDTENRLTAVRGKGIRGWVRSVKRLSKAKRKTHRHRQIIVWCLPEERGCEVR